MGFAEEEKGRGQYKIVAGFAPLFGSSGLMSAFYLMPAPVPDLYKIPHRIAACFDRCDFNRSVITSHKPLAPFLSLALAGTVRIPFLLRSPHLR
jgi:hypothetical protein